MRWGTRQRPREPTSEEFKKHKIKEYMGWDTELKIGYRTFPFPKSEPLVPILKEQLEKLDDDKLFRFKYDTTYREVTDIGRQLNTWIPTHWFRAQRASQLVWDYGFAEHDLTEWFVWRDYPTAFTYARKGYKGLAAKMMK